MPVTINLGRINSCKIVGTKNRFIEVRCAEEPVIASWDCDPVTGQCIDYGLGTGVYTDANSGGNPGDGLAACVAAPAFSNNCATLTDSGVVNISGSIHYNWLAANGHHAVDVCNFYYESMSGSIIASSCIGPNGGVYTKICDLKVYNGANVIVYTANNINDIVTYLGTLGITVNATDTTTDIAFAINSSVGILKGGHYGLSGSQCQCTGCGSPSGVSFDCVQGGTGPVCQDPGTGNGQYPTLTACNTALAAGAINSCDTNTAAGGARVNASAGMIFASTQDAIGYYTNPANGISGTDASTIFFEIAENILTNPCQFFASNTSCCEGPNSTTGSPTYMFYIPYLYIHYGFNAPMNCTCQTIVQGVGGPTICECCISATGMGVNNQPISTLIGNCYPAWATSADYNGVYGMNDLGVIQSWSWDELLTDAIAAGIPVTMNTPYMIGGDIYDPAAFTQIVWDYLDTNPSPDPDPDCHNCTTNNTCYQACTNANTWGGYTACSRPFICLSGEVCECEASCIEITYDCDPHTLQCYDPGNGLGAYTGPTALQLCQAAGCGRTTPSWDCVNGNCQDPGTGAGQWTDANSGGNPGDGLAACMATVPLNTCDAASGRVNLSPGQVFRNEMMAISWWADSTNGASGLPITSYYFEVEAGLNSNNQSGGTQNSCVDQITGLPQDCCQGSQWTTAQPTYYMTLGYFGICEHELEGTFSYCVNESCICNTNNQNTGMIPYICGGTGDCSNYSWDSITAGFMGAGITGVTALTKMAEYNLVTGTRTIIQPGDDTISRRLYDMEIAAGRCGRGHNFCFNDWNWCQCTDCDPGENWECVPGAGCIEQAGGQYLTEGDCLAANTPTNSCDTTTVVPTPQADYLDAAIELSTNYSTVDITTLSTQIVTANACKPALQANQTHCEGKEGHPMYKFGAYTFIDTQTGGPLAGLAAGYTKWSDFLTAAQAIPIAGISGSTTFDDACTAINTHYTTTACNTCPNPVTNDVVPGYWDLTNGIGVNSMNNNLAGFAAIDGLVNYITTQANGYTSKNGYDGLCTASEYTIIPETVNGQCTSSSGAALDCSTAPNGCFYMTGIRFTLLNFVLPNGPHYTNWDALLADLVADGCPGVTLTSSMCDIKPCTGGTNTVNYINAHYGGAVNAAITVSYTPCVCGGSTVTPVCNLTYECCVCEEGCPPVEPPSRGECLTLWLHADKLSSIVTSPTYPVFPPNLGGTTYYVEQWHNLAYDASVGVYPYDPTAFYTWDTITPDFSTAPILDLTTFAPHKAIMFDEGFNAKKFLIANPTGPAVLPLEPDTNPNAAYDKGWTIFFRRCTTEKGWVNPLSWFMGDDWTQTTPGSKDKASGLKPEGQPYCRSIMLGHNHANESVPDNQYEASYINESNPGGGHLYLPEGCYTHWIKACETKPTGATNNTFNVTWGIGPKILFNDVLKDVNMDMILQNINTRNRDRDFTQSGWYQEIRAYNCCFDKIQIKAEYASINSYWGSSLIPQQLPAPCGDPTNVGNVIKFDGVDQTRVEVVEAFGNESILPSGAGFTAAFWVRMDDCVDEDACFFEKGINLPGDNEEVSFRLYLTDDAAEVGLLYWDVFGDNPVSYLGNYGRSKSTVAWLGESSCANLIGKWKHIAVTMDGLTGKNRKIYINGVDVTNATGTNVSGKVKRNSNYPLVIGDSSRVDYTFKGEFSQFMTWDKSLSLGEIKDVYNNGGMFDPDVNTPSTFAEILGQKPYEDKDRLTFYTNFDSDPITHETQHSYTITKYGGVTLENTTDVDNAVLPTDIPNLQCWFRAGTKQLFDLDVSNNKISRATYMLGNTPHLKDKIRIWECNGNTGRYCMPDSVNTQTDKMLYQQTTAASAIIAPGGLYTNGSKQLQIFHTRADGGLDFPAADGTLGAFTIMVKIRLEAFSSEAVYGNTTDNMMRVNDTTTVRYKIGGAGSSDFTVPSAMTDAQPYIFTLQRDAAGNLKAYIDGGAFTDQLLTGSFTDTDAFVIDYIGGVPSQGMEGWVFDFLAWKTLLNDVQRKAQYRTINETIRTL